MPKQLFLMGVFAILGAYSRYFCDLLGVKLFNGPIPIATLFVNILGSFLIGIVMFNNNLSPVWKTALITGFLGSFTTFSALSVQSFMLLRSSFPIVGIFYLIGSPILGLLSCYIGYRISVG